MYIDNKIYKELTSNISWEWYVKQLNIYLFVYLFIYFFFLQYKYFY